MKRMVVARKSITAITLAGAVLLGSVMQVNATDSKELMTEQDIVECFHEFYEVGNKKARTIQSNIEEQFLEEYQEEICASGYEAHIVDATNYDEKQILLGTDLVDLGMTEGNTYLVLLDGGGKARNSVGGAFTHTYNGKSYKLRYVTVTAADDPIYSVASVTGNLVEKQTEKILKNCLNAAIGAYVSYASSILGTVSTICGLDISDVWPQKNVSIAMNAGTTWTRLYTQVYDGKNWYSGSCVEYAKVSAHMSGRYYVASSNSMEKIPETESTGYVYSPRYLDAKWRYDQAIIYYLNGNGVKYDVTGDIEYKYDGKVVLTHRQRF